MEHQVLLKERRLSGAAIRLFAFQQCVSLIDVELLEEGEAAIDELLAIEILIEVLHLNEERLEHYEDIGWDHVKVDLVRRDPAAPVRVKHVEDLTQTLPQPGLVDLLRVVN